MLHNQKQIDKTLLKKYMRQIKAQKINDKNQFIILPFLLIDNAFSREATGESIDPSFVSLP